MRLETSRIGRDSPESTRLRRIDPYRWKSFQWQVCSLKQELHAVSYVPQTKENCWKPTALAVGGCHEIIPVFPPQPTANIITTPNHLTITFKTMPIIFSHTPKITVFYPIHILYIKMQHRIPLIIRPHPYTSNIVP